MRKALKYDESSWLQKPANQSCWLRSASKLQKDFLREKTRVFFFLFQIQSTLVIFFCHFKKSDSRERFPQVWPVHTRHPTVGKAIKALQCIEIPGALGAYTYTARERSESSSKRNEGAMNSKYTLPGALPSDQNPIDLSWPGVRGAGKNLGPHPRTVRWGRRRRCCGSSPWPSACSPWEERRSSQRPARAPPVLPRPTQLLRAVKLLPQANILSHLFATLLV